MLFEESSMTKIEELEIADKNFRLLQID
jgi:hypothetical protein